MRRVKQTNLKKEKTKWLAKRQKQLMRVVIFQKT